MVTELANYPSFKKLEISDKEIIQTISNKYLPYSDFNFVSLIMNSQDFCAYSVLNDNLVIEFKDYITNEPFFSFLGSNSTVETVSELLDLSKKRGYKQKLRMVPEIGVTKLIGDSGDFEVIEDRNNFDYVMAVQNFIDLPGTDFFPYRKEIRRFTENYANAEFKTIDVTDEQIKENIVKLFGLRSEQKKQNPQDAENDFAATAKLLSLSKELALMAHGIYIKGKMVAYCVSEGVDEQYVMGHLKKADTTFKGIYRYLAYQTAVEFKKLGYKYINYEQDLGDEQLRKLKMLARPIEFLKKYTVARKV